MILFYTEFNRLASHPFWRRYWLWNSIYMEAALNQMRVEGWTIDSADVARLSPLVFKHLNFQGRYSFALPDVVTRGGLRPLRSPYEQDE